MTMTEADRRMRETVIEFASCLYGGSWRERLAEVSGTPKRIVNDWFRSDKALPQAIPLSMLRAMQNDAEAQIAEKQALCEQVKALRMELTAKPAVQTPAEATVALPATEPAGPVVQLPTGTNDIAAVVREVVEQDLEIPRPHPSTQPIAARRVKGRRALRLVSSRSS